MKNTKQKSAGTKASDGASRTKKKKKRPPFSRKARLTAALAAGGLVISLVIGYYWVNRTHKYSLTYLDSVTSKDLYQKPQETFEQTILVPDYTVYGTSLVFYEKPYDALATDAFYGRNATLKNIEDGSTIIATLSGGIDGGIDLQTLPQGVYEVYLNDGYTPKRAYVEEAFSAEPIVTMRDNGSIRKIQICASQYYLDKFGTVTDRPYLYLTVTDSEPEERYTDVILDPGSMTLNENGWLNPDFNEGGFDENAQSWALAHKVAGYLENAGLKVGFSHGQEEASGYSGENSRVSAGYDTQAKVFVTLTMDSEDEPRPFCVSSPFTNGRLGNRIIDALSAEGVQVIKESEQSQLNTGNTYDQLLADASYMLSPYSSLAVLRETGGKATSAGGMGGWEANAPYGTGLGMDAVEFCYASTVNADSRTYYLAHQDQIARGIARGILSYAHIDASIDPPQGDESSSASSSAPSGQPPASSQSPSSEQTSSSVPSGQPVSTAPEEAPLDPSVPSEQSAQ